VLSAPNGLISAKRNGKYDFLDRNGKEAIPFIYYEVDPFGRSFTFVRMGTEWSITNRLGQPVSFFSPGMAIRKRSAVAK
jgi:WG containing repeat